MMTINYKRDPLGMIEWQWRNVVFFLGTATVAWLLISPLGLRFLEVPVIPVSIVGGAIGIFASFRANQAYDRWWEGRRLWGALINSSRHFADQALRYTHPDDRAVAEAVVQRHVAYVHALRCLLRGEEPFADADFLRYGAADADLRGSSNLTHALLDRQLAALVPLNDAGRLDGHRLESFDRTLMDLLNIQGGCERIKGTPLPRGVGFIIEILIQIFSIILPFTLVHDLDWVAIPTNVVVCLSFALISEAGRVLEDPFNHFYNGLPLYSLSIKIERNLRERLGHADLPAEPREDPVGVLM